MKILIAALSAPAHLNGVSRHAANLIKGLLYQHEVTTLHLLVGAWQEQAIVEAIAKEDPRLHIHPVQIGSGTLSRNRWYYWGLPKIVGELDADIVHLAYPAPVSRARIACVMVVSLHDMYPFDIPENFGFPKGLANRAVVRQCLRSADAIACVSESTRERLSHWLGKGMTAKATTIANAVEPVASIQPPQELKGGTPFVLCVAQHRRNKNIPLVLRIFELIIGARMMSSQSRLVIVGARGPETQRIEQEIRRLRLQAQVLLISGVSDAELQWCYRNCAFLLAPSSIEGFGLPIVESLLAGCAVVCSDIPAFREVGGDLCRYVSLGEGELSGFGHAVHSALRAPRPSPAIVPRLAPEKIGKEYIILYHRLLSSWAFGGGGVIARRIFHDRVARSE